MITTETQPADLCTCTRTGALETRDRDCPKHGLAVDPLAGYHQWSTKAAGPPPQQWMAQPGATHYTEAERYMAKADTGGTVQIKGLRMLTALTHAVLALADELADPAR